MDSKCTERKVAHNIEMLALVLYFNCFKGAGLIYTWFWFTLWFTLEVKKIIPKIKKFQKYAKCTYDSAILIQFRPVISTAPIKTTHNFETWSEAYNFFSKQKKILHCWIIHFGTPFAVNLYVYFAV